MTIQRLHHVQITVPSDRVDEARHFYLEILGFSEIEKPDSLLHRGGFWMVLGEIQIHVGVQDDVDRHIHKTHIAYQVDDISVWRDKLGQQPVEILDSIPIPGYERFEFRDPFGNRVEMIQQV